MRACLQRSQEKGKHLLIKIFSGGMISPDVEDGRQFLLQLQKASIYVRWLAMSALPGVREALEEDTDRRNPDSSVLSYLYYIAEDLTFTAL